MHDLEDEDILHWANKMDLEKYPRLKLEVERRGLTVQPK